MRRPFGFILIIVGLGWLARSLFVTVAFVQTNGVVVDIDVSGDFYYPVIVFDGPDGTPITFRSNVGRAKSVYEREDYVTVVYDPNDPTAAKVGSTSELWFFPLILVGVGWIALFWRSSRGG